MAKHLVTFSGKFGDILWSLATVQEISKVLLAGEKLDFACMPAYKSLLPLLQAQPYIENAFVVEDWVLWHSNFGDQPWQPPKHVEDNYTKSWHLAYQHHPGLSWVQGDPRALVDFIAHQQGIKLHDPVPFIYAEGTEWEKPTVAVAVNDQYAEVKERFVRLVAEDAKDFNYVRVDQMPWFEAAKAIKGAVAFVGCRSANNVIAHGVGQENIFIYEPHPSRHAQGHLGDVFNCPYGVQEVHAPLLMPTDAAAGMAANQLRTWWSQQLERETEQCDF